MSLSDLLTKIVKQVVGNDPYSKFWECKVVRVNGDGSIDVIPEDEKMNAAELRGVKVRRGVAGWVDKVATGTGVLLCFANGDPQKPYVLGFTDAENDAKFIGKIAFNDGSSSMSRVGDSVDCGTLTISGGSGAPALGLYTPPGGDPVGPSAGPFTLQGVITSGADELKA